MTCECCQKIGEFRCPKCKQPLRYPTAACAWCDSEKRLERWFNETREPFQVRGLFTPTPAREGDG
jgi:hypothetical protein